MYQPVETGCSIVLRSDGDVVGLYGLEVQTGVSDQLDYSR